MLLSQVLFQNKLSRIVLKSRLESLFLLLCLHLRLRRLTEYDRVGGVVRAVCNPIEASYQIYVQKMNQALTNSKLEEIVCTSAQIGVLPADSNETPSSVLHYEVDENYSPIALKFCTDHYYHKWLSSCHKISSISLALGDWKEGTHYEKAVLKSLVYCHFLYLKRIGTNMFEKIEIPLPMDKEEGLSNDQITAVRMETIAMA